MKCVFEKSAEPSPRKSQSRVVDDTTHRFGTRPVGFVSDKKSAFGATFFRVVRVIFSFGKRKKRHRCTREQRTFQRTLKIVLQRNPVFSSGDFFGNVGGTSSFYRCNLGYVGQGHYDAIMIFSCCTTVGCRVVLQSVQSKLS